MPEMTPHIGLKKPLATETADISVINDNMDMIDLALGDLSTVPTTAKDAAGAIAELHSEIETIDVNIPDATLTTKGKVQLSSATNSTADDRAATPKAVKTAVDAADAAQTTANAAQTKANAALPSSSYTAADVLAKIKTVDGSDSGLDADIVRGGRVGAFWQLDNYKLASALPGSYPTEGTTIFFANADHGAHGFPRAYGTVVTFKSYPTAPCTQYFYPYLNNDPIVYRHGLNGNTWSEWRTLWDTSQLRVNTGNLEFYDGTGWKSMAAIKSIQRGEALVYVNTTQNVTISAINFNKSIVNLPVIGGQILPGRADYSVSARLINSTTLELEGLGNSGTSGYGATIPWELIEYN